jgi:hypothetical protein
MLPLSHIGADGKVIFKCVAMISLLLFGITGCNVQRGRFVTSGDLYCPFSSRGGICIVQGSPTTPLIGGSSGKDQNLLYVMFITRNFPHADESGSIVFGEYVTTLPYILNNGGSDIEVSLNWNREKDTIAVGKQEFSREKGNVFVVQLDAKGEVVCRQLASLGPDSSFQQVLDHTRQHLPNDEQIRKLTLKATP